MRWEDKNIKRIKKYVDIMLRLELYTWVYILTKAWGKGFGMIKIFYRKSRHNKEIHGKYPYFGELSVYFGVVLRKY